MGTAGGAPQCVYEISLDRRTLYWPRCPCYIYDSRVGVKVAVGMRRARSYFR